MKVYPRVEQSENKKRLSGLPPMKIIQRYTAILVAFVSVFVFFIKLLFF